MAADAAGTVSPLIFGFRRVVFGKDCRFSPRPRRLRPPVPPQKLALPSEADCDRPTSHSRERPVWRNPWHHHRLARIIPLLEKSRDILPGILDRETFNVLALTTPGFRPQIFHQDDNMAFSPMRLCTRKQPRHLTSTRDVCRHRQPAAGGARGARGHDDHLVTNSRNGTIGEYAISGARSTPR